MGASLLALAKSIYYLTLETVNNNWYCKIATNKQKKTIELMHNSA